MLYFKPDSECVVGLRVCEFTYSLSAAAFPGLVWLGTDPEAHLLS